MFGFRVLCPDFGFRSLSLGCRVLGLMSWEVEPNDTSVSEEIPTAVATVVIVFGCRFRI